MPTDLWLDVRQSLRLLAKDRAFTLSAVLTLALGIGANTAIFSVLSAALLRPVALPDPDSVIYINNIDATSAQAGLCAGDYYDFSAGATKTITDIGMARFREPLSLSTGNEEPEGITSHVATASFMRALGAKPIYGRLFVPEEEKFGNDAAVILSYGYWQRRFAGKPEVVGTKVLMGGRPTIIVGILPEGFEYPDRPSDTWTPLAPLPTEVQQRFLHRYNSIARLKPGATIDQAKTELRAINQRLSREFPKTNNFDLRIVPLSEQRSGNARSGLWMLMAAVGLVLVIACANVANLLLARATSRQREIAVRVALGASRGRILRQVFTESALLSIIGGAFGIALAYLSIRSFQKWLPPTLPGRDSIVLDPSTMWFAVAISLATGLIFGISPALHSAKAEAAEALRQRSNSGSRRSLRLRSVLVVAEVAVSAILLVGSGLLARSFLRVMAIDPGLDPNGVLSMQLSLPRNRYNNPEKVNRFFDELLRKLHEVPGVESAGIVNRLPLNGSVGSGPLSIEGQPNTPTDVPTVDWRSVDPDYFRTMRIAQVSGRGLLETDRAGAQEVIVIDDRIAKRFWPNQDPIGKRAKFGNYDSQYPWMQVVGVVRNIKHNGLEQETFGQVYRSYWQYPIQGLNIQNYALVIRSRGVPPESLSGPARHAIAQVDGSQTASEVRTMETILDSSVANRRFQTFLVGGFAALALLLASLGLYAVIAYGVMLRTPEIGIRMALGAGGADVLSLVATQTFRMVAAGLVIGLAGAVILSRWVQSLLFGVNRFDVPTFIAASVAVVVVALLATLAPARRALRIDPARALVTEG